MLYLMAVLKSSRSVSRQEVLVTLSWRSLGTPNIRFSYITFLGIVTPGATILARDWLISTIYKLLIHFYNDLLIAAILVLDWLIARILVNDLFIAKSKQ